MSLTIDFEDALRQALERIERARVSDQEVWNRLEWARSALSVMRQCQSPLPVDVCSGLGTCKGTFGNWCCCEIHVAVGNFGKMPLPLALSIARGEVGVEEAARHVPDLARSAKSKNVDGRNVMFSSLHYPEYRRDIARRVAEALDRAYNASGLSAYDSSEAKKIAEELERKSLEFKNQLSQNRDMATWDVSQWRDWWNRNRDRLPPGQSRDFERFFLPWLNDTLKSMNLDLTQNISPNNATYRSDVLINGLDISIDTNKETTISIAVGLRLPDLGIDIPPTPINLTFGQQRGNRVRIPRSVKSQLKLSRESVDVLKKIGAKSITVVIEFTNSATDLLNDPVEKKQRREYTFVL